MHDAIRVHVRQRRHELVRVPPHVCLVHAAPLRARRLNGAVQIAAVGELEHQVEIVALHERVDETHNVRVVQALQQRRLVQTLLARLCVHLKDLFASKWPHAQMRGPESERQDQRNKRQVSAKAYPNALHRKCHSRLHVQHPVHGREMPLPDEAEHAIVLQ